MGKEALLIQTQKKTLQNSLKKLRQPSLLLSSIRSQIRVNRSDLKNKIISKLKIHQIHKQNSYKQGWQSKFKKFIQSKQQSYEINCASTCQFSCPICLDMFMTPCPTSCGHMFCYRCIDESIIRHGHCPSCRKFIRNEQFIQSKPFSQISHFFWMTSKEKNNYLQKLKKNEQWLNKRKIDIKSIKVNDLLDVKDTEHIWCKAKIINIFKLGEKTDLLIHFQGWNDIYDQVISASSQRLAPYNCFSEREDIPKYKLSQQQDNLRSRIDYRDPNDRQGYRQMMFMVEQDEGGAAANRHFNRNLPFLFNNARPWRIQREMNFRLIRRQDQNLNEEMSELSSDHINVGNQLINEAINIRRGIQRQRVRLDRQRRRQMREQLQRQSVQGSSENDENGVENQIDLRESEFVSQSRWGIQQLQVHNESVEEGVQPSSSQNVEDQGNSYYYAQHQGNEFVNRNIIVVASNSNSNSNNINNQNSNQGEQIEGSLARQNQNQHQDEDPSMEQISLPVESAEQSMEEIGPIQNLNESQYNLTNLRPHISNHAQRPRPQNMQQNASQQQMSYLNPEQEASPQRRANEVDEEIARQNQEQYEQQQSGSKRCLYQVGDFEEQSRQRIQHQYEILIEQLPQNVNPIIEISNRNEGPAPELSLEPTTPKQSNAQINLIEDEPGRSVAQNKQRVRNLSPIHSSESQPISDLVYNSNKSHSKKE